MMAPDVVLGGAPKCGTSSLFGWLSSHPEICGATPKETFFFMDKEHPLINKKNNFYLSGADYSGYFSKVQGKKLEGTTHYLYQKSTPKMFSDLGGHTKVLFVLREPASRVYSSFTYTKNNLAAFSKDITFAEYLSCVMKNEPLEALDQSRSAYVLRHDVEYGYYKNYLDYWYDNYDRERIKVIIFEELKENPKEVLSDVCKFIDIDFLHFKDYSFQKKNETVHISNKPLHRAGHKINKVLSKVLDTSFLKKLYFNLQGSAKQVDVDKGDMEALEMLKEHYHPYNQQLSALLGKKVWN